MPEEKVLKIEDQFFNSTSVVFIQTITDMLFISVNEGDSKLTVILNENDVERIRDFLKNWD